MTRQVCVMAALAAFVCVGGCRKQTADIVQPTPEDLYASIRTTVDAQREAGDWDAARAALQSGFGDPRMEIYRADLFRELMLVELETGATNAAVELHMQYADDGQLCGIGFNMLGEAFMRSGDREGLLDWVTPLLREGVPDWVQQRVWSVVIDDLVSKGELAALPGRLDEMLAVPPAVQLSVCANAARAMVAAGVFDALDALIAGLEGRQERLPWVPAFVAESQLDSLLAQKRLDEAAAVVLKKGALVADGALWRRVGKLLAAMERAGSPGYDGFVRDMFVALPTQPNTIGRLAIQWVRNAADKKDANLLVRRMDEVLAVAAISPDMKARCFRRTFYDIAGAAVPQQQVELGRLCDDLYAQEGLSDAERQPLALVRLDSAFYTQGWRRALDILDQGIPNKDEAWHSELKNKVGAHLALSEERYEDAIAAFRKHMEVVAGWEEDVPNPEANAMMCKEAVLGFNERRIGDIYIKMGGRQADADQAYVRARAHYQDALGKLAPDSKAFELATAELATVPVPAAAVPAPAEETP